VASRLVARSAGCCWTPPGVAAGRHPHGPLSPATPVPKSALGSTFPLAAVACFTQLSISCRRRPSRSLRKYAAPVSSLPSPQLVGTPERTTLDLNTLRRRKSSFIHGVASDAGELIEQLDTFWDKKRRPLLAAFDHSHELNGYVRDLKRRRATAARPVPSIRSEAGSGTIVGSGKVTLLNVADTAAFANAVDVVP
jgi:hypothetical protein